MSLRHSDRKSREKNYDAGEYSPFSQWSGPASHQLTERSLHCVLQMKSNSLAWNPTLPTVLLLASEDHNLYTFDLRKLETPTQIYKGHVASVMSCDWSESLVILTIAAPSEC